MFSNLSGGFSSREVLIFGALVFAGVLILYLQTGSLVSENVKENNSGKVPVGSDTESLNISSPEECQKMRITGKKDRKADILLVARNYRSDAVMMEDLRYYMDFDQDNRGLFDVYPMNVSMDKFNVWVLDAGVGNIGEYEDSRDKRGLIKDSRDHWFPKCSFADYKVVMSKDGFNNNAFASGQKDMYIPDIAAKVEERNGAVALIHEWGHGFAGLKDEYSSPDGKDAHGKPNCADNRSQAEKWWGKLARKHPKVGYERGCAYTDQNWEPHIAEEGTIMGDGGLWHYGPVNDRKMLDVLENYG